MKRLLTLLALIITLSVSAQTDSVINYTDSLVYLIDGTIIAGEDTIIGDSNYVQHNYHFIASDSTYEDQFVILDSIGEMLVPIQALMDMGFSNNGTTLMIKLDSIQILWTPEQLRDSLILPKFRSVYGDSNITKL